MSTKTLHVTFARMNPPTKAHIDLVGQMYKESDGHFLVYLSSTHNDTNPLTFEERKNVITNLHSSLEFHLREARDLFSAMDEADAYMKEHGYTEIVLWGGSDRISALERVLLYPDRWSFKVQAIKEVDRSSSDISATAVRTAAVNRDTHTFVRMIACAYDQEGWLFETLHERLTDGSLQSTTKTSKRSSKRI